MSLRLFLPRDTTAAALGADRGGACAAPGRLSIGVCPSNWCATVPADCSGWSRCSRWNTAVSAVAFGPVTVDAVPQLLDALATDPAGHPLFLGPVRDIP